MHTVIDDVQCMCDCAEGSRGCELVEIFRCQAQQASFSPSLPTPWTDVDYDSFCK